MENQTNPTDFRMEDQVDETADMDMDDTLDEETIEEGIEELESIPYRPSMRARAVSILTAILQTNLVWYVAGLVDGLILFKLFGG